ncbi:hypothetical protein [Wolbachia endosymbiont (group A) of Beris morrisii]
MRKANLTPLFFANSVPRKSGAVVESDSKQVKDKDENTNLEQESGVPNTGSFDELCDTPSSTRSFCISAGTPDEEKILGLEWDNYSLYFTDVNQDLKLSQKSQEEIVITFSQINESTDLGIVQEKSTTVESKKDATINLQLDGQNKNKILVASDEEAKGYDENNNSPLVSSETLLSEGENDTSSSVQEATFARDNPKVMLSEEDIELSISNNFDINNFSFLNYNKESGNDSGAEFTDGDDSGREKVDNEAEIFLGSNENISSPILSEESFVTAKNEGETYKSPNNSIFIHSNGTQFDVSEDGIYTHDDSQDVSLRNEQNVSKEGLTGTLVKLDDGENKNIKITGKSAPGASKQSEGDNDQLLNGSEPLISRSSTPNNSPKDVNRKSTYSKLSKICRDKNEGEKSVYKTSSYNPSQKNSKGKKVFLCLTVLSCTVFFVSITSSFLGKPLISDLKGNLISLAILGTACVILGAITLVLYCYPQDKENEPPDALEQVSVDDTEIEILSS